MSDFVYKQMINKVTNLPIQGGVFFLRNVETLEDYDFDELPDDGTGSTQGRYVTTTVVPNGVYKIYRVVASVDTDTGDEVHVEPGRVMHGGLDGDPFYPPVSRVVGDVVHVAGFIPDEETDTLSSYITDAMAWAVANNYSSIKVGGFKGSSTWTGATTIVVPAGIDHIDLDGATIACTGANIVPINNEATKLHISNGGIQGNGTGSTPHVTSAYGILYTSVTFIGFGGGSPVQGFTTTTSGGTPTLHTVYVGCRNVRFDGGYRQRAPGVYAAGTQAAFGGEYPVDTGTGSQAHGRNSVLFSDVDAVELTQWIRASLNLPVAAPVDVARFTSMTAVAEAVKHLWYTTKPYIDTLPTAIGNLEDSVATAIAGSVYVRDYAVAAGEIQYNWIGTSSGSATNAADNTNMKNGLSVMRFTDDVAYNPSDYGKLEFELGFLTAINAHRVTLTNAFFIYSISFPVALFLGNTLLLPDVRVNRAEVTVFYPGSVPGIEMASDFFTGWVRRVGTSIVIDGFTGGSKGNIKGDGGTNRLMSTSAYVSVKFSMRDFSGNMGVFY